MEKCPRHDFECVADKVAQQREDDAADRRREAEYLWREHMGLEPDADDDYWRGESIVEQPTLEV